MKHDRSVASLPLILIIGIGSAGAMSCATSPSTSGTSGSSNSGMVDETGSADTGGGDSIPIYESIAGGAFTPLGQYQAQGRAHLVRHLDGRTTVELYIEGLAADTMHPTHVHGLPCSVDDGGGHYQIEPGGAADNVNEIWPELITDADGIGLASITVDHLARQDAQSIVVHDPNAENARIACADLKFDPTEIVELEGSFAPFAAAEAIDDNIAGTAQLTRDASSTTVVVDVTGLDPAETYMAHVHEFPCDVVDGGAHYQRTPGGPATAENELWPQITPDDAGAATDTLEVDHVARADTQSLVIHRMTADGTPRVACATLVRTAYPDRFTTRGPSMLLPGGQGSFDNLSVEVSLERDLAGNTHGQLLAQEASAGEYPVHVHHRPCTTNEGGAHYKIDPQVEDTVEDNELWLNFSPADDGQASAQFEVEHTARPEAQAVVVHNPEDSTIRLVCADLDND